MHGISLETGIKVMQLGNPTKPEAKDATAVSQSLSEFLFSDDKVEEKERVGYVPIEVDRKDIEKIYHVYV